MPTKARWVNGILTYYDSQTQEQLLPIAPIVFYDDFLGADLMVTETGSTGPWATVEVALNTAMGVSADVANGVLAAIIDADSNAEDAVLYWNNQKGISVKQGAIFEARIRMSVLPTTGVAVVFGMAGDHNLDKDSITEGAWFRFQASAALLCESDDTTNNNDDKAAGKTVVATDYHIYRIDFTDIADVRFYYDGEHVAAATTFDMSNLTDAEAVMQPYFSLDKASGTGVGTMLLDYVRIWSKRS